LAAGEDVLEIVHRSASLETYNIPTQEIYQVVSANNQLVPAARLIRARQFAVKVFRPDLHGTGTALSLPSGARKTPVVTLSDC